MVELSRGAPGSGGTQRALSGQLVEAHPWVAFNPSPEVPAFNDAFDPFTRPWRGPRRAELIYRYLLEAGARTEACRGPANEDLEATAERDDPAVLPVRGGVAPTAASGVVAFG